MAEPDRPDARGADRSARSPVRPYTLTRGRTAARGALAPEAVVAAAESGSATAGGLGPEAVDILGLCRPWSSVAEISARLHLPLGVVRVLLGDLRDAGLVHIHESSPDHGEDTDQLERALRELRKRI